MRICLISKLLLLSLLINTSNSQSSYNMYLLKQLNEHYSPSGYSACWGYAASNGREYALLGCIDGTAFIDITDSANIREVDYQPGPVSQWREMKVYSNYAYIVSEAPGSVLQIVDLRYLPDSVHFVRSFSFSGYSSTHTISQSGPYLYLNGANNNGGGVTILDLSVNPEMPVVRGSWTTRYIHDCRVLNDTIWAANIYDGLVTIINAVNKDNLQEVRNWNNGSNPAPHNCDITADRKYIFVTDETTIPPGRLKVWNIENLNNIQFVTSWFPPSFPNSVVHNIEIYGNYAVIANFTAGVRVLNITNPASPVEVAWYDTYLLNDTNITEGCWGVFKFPSGKIIASDEEYGLFVLKTTFPIGISKSEVKAKEFLLYQNYPNPFNPVTRIRFDIPRAGNVMLKVFDITGKEIERLLNEFKNPGSYELSWNGQNLSSGVYFYQLIAESFSGTKAMVMVK